MWQEIDPETCITCLSIYISNDQKNSKPRVLAMLLCSNVGHELPSCLLERNPLAQFMLKTFCGLFSGPKKELKGGSWIVLWWFKVNKWKYKSERWACDKVYEILMFLIQKMTERCKNKLKILDLKKGYLISLGYWYGYCVRAKDTPELAVPERLSSKVQTLAILMWRSAKSWTLQGLKPQEGIVIEHGK